MNEMNKIKQKNDEAAVITLLAFAAGFLIVYALRHEPIIVAFGDIVAYGLGLFALVVVVTCFWKYIKLVAAVLSGAALLVYGAPWVEWLFEIDPSLVMLLVALFIVALMVLAYKKMGSKDDAAT